MAHQPDPPAAQVRASCVVAAALVAAAAGHSSPPVARVGVYEGVSAHISCIFVNQGQLTGINDQLRKSWPDPDLQV